MDVCLKIDNITMKYIFPYRTNYEYFINFLKYIQYPLNVSMVDDITTPDVVVGVFGGVDFEKYKKSIKFIIFGEVNHRATGSKCENTYYFSSGDEKFGELCYRCPVLMNFVLPSNYKKNKIVSAIDSGKYKWRVDKIKEYVYRHNIQQDIDMYGNGLNVNNVPTGYHGFPNGKQGVLDNYMFSLCIENTSQKDYFTEKIVDPILTNTVPIYYGCTNIFDYFYSNGYINYENDNVILNENTYKIYSRGLEKNKKLLYNRYNLLSYFYLIFTNMSLVVWLILTIAFGFLIRFSIPLGVCMIPLPTIFLSALHIIPINISIAIGLEIAALVVAVFINSRG